MDSVIGSDYATVNPFFIHNSYLNLSLHRASNWVVQPASLLGTARGRHMPRRGGGYGLTRHPAKVGSCLGLTAA